MLNSFVDNTASAVPIVVIPSSEFADWMNGPDDAIRKWLTTTGFRGKPGNVIQVPDTDGNVDRVVFTVAENPSLWDWAALPGGLRTGTYAPPNDMDPAQATDLALVWALSAYKYDRYKKRDDDDDTDAKPTLVWPETCDRKSVIRTVEATGLVRDLINTPAADMGPDGLAAAARGLAEDHGAALSIIEGEDLLTQNYPAIHAVGRANDRAPRLIDLIWGDDDAPKVTLVGKGVCFDTGGLDIKSAAGMKLMKKDMGGAAHALGLARMVMAAKLPVRLRLLVPAVENSIAGNAMRPGDVVPTRKGLSIEIGNTDAEGRVILADALTEGASEKPELMIDFATLTGAARVALGTELPALFCNDDTLAGDLLTAGTKTADALWRMPLWAGYDKLVDGKVADLNNAPEGGHGGAITAALFLQRFVDAGIPWAHIDLMAWNLTSRPGRPEGGEAMGLRAVFDALAQRYPA